MNLNPKLYDFCNTLQIPFNMERWRSTPIHNASPSVKGAPNSKHLTGDAIDLSFDTEDDLHKAAAEAYRQEFPGIEVDLTNNHLHIDTGPRIWRVIKQADRSYTPLTPLDT